MKVVSVNRKKEIYNNKDNSYSISILPDSSISKDSDLFYNPFPDFRVRFSAGICLKISKIGKCISEKFATKYYENIGLAVHFYSEDFKRYCMSKDIDYVLSYAFDKAFWY
ncbi:MAG: hypothetical protein IPO21_03840 [Bacteroidales bacterium]|nr:hypothetical protein [Bacteroidales bacterium]